jgi:phosphatidylinositol 4-kinase
VLERLLEIAMGSVDDDSFDDVDDDERVTPEARSRSTEADIEVVEFFWPQLMQLHLLLSRKFTPQTTALVDGLQTFLLLLAGRHFVLAQKLAWGLAGSLEDCKGSNPAQLTHSQYVSCLSLLFQLEKVVTGSIGLLDGTTSGGSNPVFSELTSVSSHHKAILMQHFALLFANRSSRYASWLRFSPNNVASGLDEDAHQDLTAQSSLLLMDSMAEVGPIFLQQMNFLARLTYIVDMLRFVDREKRKLQLLEYMRQLELELDGTMGYSPITSASEPVLQIVKIVKDSCHVFRTKARAPSLIVAEVVQAQAAPLTRRRKHFATEGIQGEELEKLVEHHQNSLMQGMEMQEHGQGPDAAAETNDGASEGKSDGAEMVPGPSTSTACFLGQTTQSAGESGRLLEPRTPFKSATYTQERVTDAQQHAAELIAMLETQGIRSPAAAEQTTFSSEQGLSALPPGSSVELVQRRPRDTSDEQPAGQVKQIINTARQLLSDGEISDEEFRQLLRNDSRFREVSRRLDEEFWIARRFGESWTEKVARLRATSEFGTMAGWNLCSFIVKSNDDLRQEMCCMQMIELCSDIFRDANLDLRLRPYRIISTSARTGLVETLVDTISLDALKKTDDFVDLPTYFAEVYSGSEERLSKAKHAFASSLAAYSLLCYLLMIKDRHNGNILIDRDGHMVHIDFGFIMGIAPGGSFSLETAPFKLTSEMVDVLGGFRSPLFNEFVRLFVAGFVALQANAETIVKSFELLAYSSPFPCLVGQDPQRVVERFRTRFRQELKRDDTARFCMDLIVQSYNNYGARQYDYYQWYTNSIMP